MAKYRLAKAFESKVEKTQNVLAVAEMFGLEIASSEGGGRSRYVVLDDLEVRIEPGWVVYITGGSGTGKTTVLQLLKEQMGVPELEDLDESLCSEEVIDLAEVEIDGSTALVDCFEGSFEETMGWLSLAGLSEATALIRTPQELSEGQRYRFRLALAMAKQPRAICIDECCSMLDRVTAAVVAHNIRKYADRFGTIFVVATSHDDLLEDLCPNVVVLKHFGSGCEVFYPAN
ncbi:MAG: ATP-binding cassette domain-containing protein [Planctomycetes bacterium]|nr:ATP-binding cassette domain-containing protein [Planctomycetota bacterium]